MRTTAIFNYKGGTGKTTTAINLAAELAARGKRVLLVDADGQRNATDFLVGEQTGFVSIYELLTAEVGPYEACFAPTPHDNLFLLPSSDALATVELAVISGSSVLRLDALRELCDILAGEDAMDYVLIDCPPSFAPQSVAALLAADDLIIPVTPDSFAVSGLRDLSTSLTGARKSNPRLRIAGVLLTHVARVAVARDAEEAIRASGYPVFDATIRESHYPHRSTFTRTPLRELAGWSRIAQDYRDLCDDYLEGGDQIG